MSTRTWLVPTLLAATLAGCAGDQRTPAETIRDSLQATRDAVQEAVDDSDRRAELLLRVDEMERLIEAQYDELERLGRSLQGVNADPDATRSAFQAELAAFESGRRSRRDRVVALHFEMMGLTGPDEWSQIVRRELEALGQMGRLEEVAR